MSPRANAKKRLSPSSAARSFTVRDLNRQPAKVLAACDQQGTVHIRTRDGRTYCLTLETPEPAKTAHVESLIERRQRLRERLKAAGFSPPSPGEMDRIHRIIAGEE